MRLHEAQESVNALIDTHVALLEGADEQVLEKAREALQNARQDLLLLVEEIVKQCLMGINLDGALTDAEEITREGRGGS